MQAPPCVDFETYASERNPSESVARAARILKRLGAARVRTTLFLLRFEGVSPGRAAEICRAVAGPSRVYARVDSDTFLIVDIGPRASKRQDYADGKVTDYLKRSIARLLDRPVSTSWPSCRAYLRTLHGWSVELADLDLVVGELSYAPAEEIKADLPELSVAS